MTARAARHVRSSRRMSLATGAGALSLAGSLAGILAGCSGLTPPRTATPNSETVTAVNGLLRGPCNQSVASVLAGENIPISAFRSASYNEIRGGPSASVSQYEAWLYPQNQRGAIVVDMDNVCRPMQIYGRGGADLQSVRAR